MKELYLILIHTMKKRLKLLLLLLAATLPLKAQDVIVKGPDGNLQVAVTCIGAERLSIPSLIKTNKCWKILRWAWKPTWATLQKA